MRRRGLLGPPVAKRNRQIMKDKILTLTAEITDLEFQISDYRQANEGLAQTIKDMNDLHFEWRERLEKKHEKQIHELNFLVRNLRREIRRLELITK